MSQQEEPNELLFMSQPSFREPYPSKKTKSPFEVKLSAARGPFQFSYEEKFEDSEAEKLGPEFFRVDYQFHTFMPVLLNVLLFENGSDVKLSWNPKDAFSYRYQINLEPLRALAINPDVWSPTHTLAIRSNWSLEWWSPPFYRRVGPVYPPPGPLFELCLAILTTAGFEFETKVCPLNGHEYRRIVGPSD